MAKLTSQLVRCGCTLRVTSETSYKLPIIHIMTNTIEILNTSCGMSTELASQLRPNPLRSNNSLN
jgi:hypothetical protein